MASFKAFSQWFGTERQASLNAAIMAAGGLGALTASTPLAWAIPAIRLARRVRRAGRGRPGRRRAIFSTPDKPAGAAPEPLSQPACGPREVLASRAFWRYAPQSTLIIGGFLACRACGPCPG
jgi:hypothetical protein